MEITGVAAGAAVRTASRRPVAGKRSSPSSSPSPRSARSVTIAVPAVNAKAPGCTVMCAGRGTMAGTESDAKAMTSAANIGTRLVLQLPDPDVPVARRVTVVLQEEGKPVRMRLVVRTRGVHGPAGDDRIVLHQRPVVQHRYPRRVVYRTIRREPGAVENDVVRLPLAGGSAGVHERRGLSVHGSGLAVGVGLVAVRIEHLDLVVAHQEHTAVTALLTLTLGRRGRRPLDMELDVSEDAPSDDRPGAGDDFRIPVPYQPSCGRAVLRLPLREILAVEQHDGVGWRRRRGSLGPGIDHRRPRSIHRVNRPLLGAHRGRDHESEQEDWELATQGFHVPLATAGTNRSMPAGGKSSVLPSSALLYAVIRSFTTSRPSSNVSSGDSRPRNTRTKCRSSASYP